LLVILRAPDFGDSPMFLSAEHGRADGSDSAMLLEAEPTNQGRLLAPVRSPSQLLPCELYLFLTV